MGRQGGAKLGVETRFDQRQTIAFAGQVIGRTGAIGERQIGAQKKHRAGLMITGDGQRPFFAQRAHHRRQLPADLKRVGARQDPTDQDRHHRRASHHHRRRAARVTPTPNAITPATAAAPGQETGRRPQTIGPAKVDEGPIGGAKTEQNTGAEDPKTSAIKAQTTATVLAQRPARRAAKASLAPDTAAAANNINAGYTGKT